MIHFIHTSIRPIFYLIAVISKHNLPEIPHSHILNLPSVVTSLMEGKKEGGGASKEKKKTKLMFSFPNLPCTMMLGHLSPHGD